MQAYEWLINASDPYSGTQNDQVIAHAMEVIGQRMTPAQIEQVRQAASAWREAHPMTAYQMPPDYIDAAFDPTKPCMHPAYPVDAQMRRQTGSVKIKLWIAASGAVTQSEVIKSSGFPSLDQAALDSFGKCAYTPSLRRGLPIDDTKYVDYTWRE